MVIMDTEVIAKAPVRFLMAGIGDALATYYEAAACEQSDADVYKRQPLYLSAHFWKNWKSIKLKTDNSL